MIKINIYPQNKEFHDYIHRATLTVDGLDQTGRLINVCKGDNTFLYRLLTINNNITHGIQWIVINEDDIRYIMKYSLEDLPDERDLYKDAIVNPYKDAIAMKGIEFIGIEMKNGDTLMCPISELGKLEKLIS